MVLGLRYLRTLIFGAFRRLSFGVSYIALPVGLTLVLAGSGVLKVIRYLGTGVMMVLGLLGLGVYAIARSTGLALHPLGTGVWTIAQAAGVALPNPESTEGHRWTA